MGLAELYQLPQQSPTDWGAAKDYDAWANRPTSQVFVHWGGTPVSAGAAAGEIAAEHAQLRSWESYHLSKGWQGLAYDWAVGNSGTLYRIRGDAQSGATRGDIDLDGISNNREAEAVVVIVGQGQTASPAALATLRRVLDTLGYAEVYGHRESAQQGTGTATSCPGDQLQAWIDSYRTAEEDDVLKRGDAGPKVLELQKQINRVLRGHHDRGPLTLDAVFGPATEAAMKDAERTMGYPEDGVADLEDQVRMLHIVLYGDLKTHRDKDPHSVNVDQLDQRYAAKAHPHDDYSPKGHQHSGEVTVR